jgi:DNA helicase II / ATP-dependent DNA helicase PcrA
MADNPNTPPSALEKLATDEDANVRRAAAENPNTPASFLEKLAADEDKWVRRAVAGNPNTPASLLEKLLEKLAADEDKGVRRGAAIGRTRTSFTLPGIQDLNKDQDEARALPMGGQYLIVGGPGTGKSVVALWRARRMAQAGKNYTALVYNHLLNQANRHLFGTDQTLAAETWESWIREIVGSFLGTVPTLEPGNAGGYRPIDWESVEQKIQESTDVQDLSGQYLVIDEGQDMPPAFYRTLVSLGFENFYVVADQNQQIYPEKCSSRLELENILAIDGGETLELSINYRNTHPIARLAEHFYPDDPASPKPDLPAVAPTARTPELWTYGTENTPTLAEIANKILRLNDRDPRKLIGIITPNNNVRTKFFDALRSANPELDNDKPPIQTYSYGQNEALDFGQGGLMVINVQSCKGLEFDIAIMADIDQHQPKHNLPSLKKRFYVMMARARDVIVLLRTGQPCPVVDGLLPTDPTVLVRK